MSSDRQATGADARFTEHLELLVETGRDFASSLDINDTLAKALARIAGYVQAEAASLFLLENDERDLVCRACFGPVSILGLRIAPDQGIVGRSIQDNACQMVRDVRLDPDFDHSVDEGTGFRTLSLLCAPMSVKDRRVGAIELLNKRGGEGLFAEADQRFLEVLASSAALAIINARLTAAAIEQEKTRRELELAREIQRSLLPRRPAAGFPVTGLNVPARGVSGDFFDFFSLPDGCIGFNVGDVSGKGMNAALLMAKTSGLYHCLAKTVRDPGRLLGLVNAEICEMGTRGMFVTMAAGVYDPESGLVRLANAGHEPPLYRCRNGVYQSFPAEAPPLGIGLDLVAEEGYPVIEFALAGGTLAIFTDGITEGKLADGNMLGVEGLKAIVEEHRHRSPADRLKEVLARINRPGAALHDDLTILLLEAPEADVAADAMR